MTDPIWTVSFWKVALANGVHAAAGAVLGPLLAVLASLANWTSGQNVSIPWQSLVISAVGGAAASLALSLGGKQLPNTLGATFIPAGKPPAAKKSATITHPIPSARRKLPGEHDHGRHESPPK